MSEGLETTSADFERRPYVLDGKAKTVLVAGSGPAVLVLHEIFGVTPTLIRLCRWIREAGFTVYAPVLLGAPNTSNPEVLSPWRVLGVCISREFNLLRSGRSSPVTDWLRLLAHKAHEECGGPGVGVIGLCLTGGFALSMAVDPVVLAPVMGEPSAPALRSDGLDISDADLERVRARTKDEGLSIQGYRFAGDKLCRARRFERLSQELGAAFDGETLPDDAANPDGFVRQRRPPHSVFTADLIDGEGEPTREAVEKVLAFFRSKLL